MSVTRNYPLHRAVEDFPWPSGKAPEFEVPTRYGTVVIRAYAQDRIGVSGGRPHNVEGSERTALTIRGVEYSVFGVFRLWSDGQWHAGEEDSRESQWREPHLSRRDSTGKDASQAAQRTAREELEAVVNEWASNHQVALAAGEKRSREQAAHRLAEQLDRLTDMRQRVIDELAKVRTGEPYNTYPNSADRR